ncbi:MAG: hypothetical protein EOP51_34700, partial [Sphingobacteriales bacterium]
MVNIDFGRGPARFGTSLGGATEYRYDNSGAQGTPNDGSYTIAKTTAGMNSGWYTIANHTPNTPDGYMMVVNVDKDPGIFYESQIPIDLCQNTTYEFAAWVVNILRNDGVEPNITFEILDMTGKVLGRYDTGNIPDRDPNWRKYGFLFQTTSSARVRIRMISNVHNPTGAGGNDLAIDDITFRACGPVITSKFTNNSSAVQNLCEGESEDYAFAADVQGSPTLQFQWQVNRDKGGWSDIPGENARTMTRSFTNADDGLYEYRFTVAEPGNFNSINCRT